MVLVLLVPGVERVGGGRVHDPAPRSRSSASSTPGRARAGRRPPAATDRRRRGSWRRRELRALAASRSDLHSIDKCAELLVIFECMCTVRTWLALRRDGRGLSLYVVTRGRS